MMPFWIVVLGWVTKVVMGLLIGLSIWSIQIMLDRRRFLKLQSGQDLTEVRKWISNRDWLALNRWLEHNSSPHATILKQCVDLRAAPTEQVDRAVDASLATLKPTLEKGLLVLGSLGSNAPFIGLFGTVLGIIQAFGALSQNQGQNMNLVMAGIAEALIATAIGLLVAIPAVVAFNYFSTRVRTLISECQSLKNHFLALRSPSGS